MLLATTNEYINSTGLPLDGLENTKEGDLVDMNSNFYDAPNHVIQALYQELGSVDYSDDDLEVDRDEEVRT